MKKLTVAVALDDGQGMLFFGKRQSRDRVLIDDLLGSVDGAEVYISPFSKLLFEGKSGVNITESPIEDAPSGAVCFIENIRLSPYIDLIDTLIIYRWNRLYPSDFKFDIDIKKMGFTLDTAEEFTGSSHEKITKEIYRR